MSTPSLPRPILGTEVLLPDPRGQGRLENVQSWRQIPIEYFFPGLRFLFPEFSTPNDVVASCGEGWVVKGEVCLR